MMDSTPRPLPDLSLDQKLRLNALCDGFERALQAGEQPRIEDFLVAEPSLTRAVMLRELIELELDYRRQRGQQPDAIEYEQRFPEGREVLPLVFGDLEETPAVIGRYRVLAILGQGRFGKVFLAKHPELDKRVAVKIPNPNVLISRDMEASIDRYLAEGRRMASLRHPAIVTIHDADRDRAVGCFLVMDYIEGGSLEGKIRAQKAPFPSNEAIRLVSVIAEGVQHAHDEKVVHRDLKPANILLDLQGRPRITDFGLALERFDLRYHEGDLAGTPAYMAPEQWRKEVQDLDDGKADVWALGVILYELLTGRRPFAGKDLDDLKSQVLHGAPIPLRQFSPMVGEDLEALCLRCLEKSAARRPNAGELARLLQRFAITDQGLGGSGASPVSSGTSVTEPLTRSSPNSRYRIIIAAGVALMVGFLGWLVLGGPRNAATQGPNRDTANDVAAKKSVASTDPGPGTIGPKSNLAGGPKSNPVSSPKANPVGEVHCLRGHSAAVNMVAFSPDATRAVSASDDRTAIIWDVASEKVIHRLAKHSEPVKSVAYSQDGSQVLSGGGFGDNAIILWDAQTGQELRRLDGHRHGVRGLAFLPNGNQAVSCSFDGTVRLWNLEDGKELHRFPGFDQPNLDALDKQVWDKQVWCVAVSGDGKRLACGVRDRTARVFDIASSKEVNCLRGHKSTVNAVALDHDGQRLLSGGSDGTVRVWDVGSGKVLKENPSPVGKIWSVAWSPGRKRALTVGEDRSVLIWDPESGKEIQRFSGHTAEVFGATFSANGSLALTGSADKTARVWKLPE
jgi:eukaryotic-like serine/threonine-protein kinase